MVRMKLDVMRDGGKWSTFEIEWNGYHVQVTDVTIGQEKKVVFARGVAYAKNMDGWYDEMHQPFIDEINMIEKGLSLISSAEICS